MPQRDLADALFDIPAVPDWVREKLAPRVKPAKASGANVEPDKPGDLSRAKAYLSDLVSQGRVAIAGHAGNDFTYRVAAQLRDLGVSEDKTADLMREIYNPACVPPWDETELRTIVHNAFSYSQNAPGVDAVPAAAEVFGQAAAKLSDASVIAAAQSDLAIPGVIAGSDRHLSALFVETYGMVLLFVREWSKWLQWRDSRWSKQSTPAIWNLIGPLAYRIAIYTPGLSEAQRRKGEAKAFISSAEALARGDSRVEISASELDSDPLLLGTPNGYVDLRTGELHAPDASKRITKSTAVAPDANCPVPRWLKFLARVTDDSKELQDYVQRVAGYCLTGLTIEHILFFFYGIGANGKGVYLNTLTNILGKNDYAKVAPVGTFTASKNERHPTELAGLEGARLVPAQETNKDNSWDEAKIKMLSGGDPVSSRLMHQDFSTYVPQFKIIVAGNHKPRLHNVDEAIKRRLHLVPFGVTIPENERDLDLPEKLQAEWPGILAWAIQGCLQWQREGLNPPGIVKEATQDYFSSQDPIITWIEARCVRDGSAWTSTRDLFADYRAYVSLEDGGGWHNINPFSERLEGHGFIRKKRDVRGFGGIALKSASDAHPAIADEVEF